MRTSRSRILVSALLILTLLLSGCESESGGSREESQGIKKDPIQTELSGQEEAEEAVLELEYEGEPYVEINGGQPFFSEEEEKDTEEFETYSKLDGLGRCGTAYANVCEETMPDEKRGSIGQVKPSGWHTAKYSDLVEGNYLYNRCHLIAFELSGENANERNLITGTRYMNVQGMLPLENKVAEYVRETDHHVLYRVTPVFKGEELVARGVIMEAYSVEDQGEGISLCVYAFNVQPGIDISYSDGSSQIDKEELDEKKEAEKSGTVYVVNKGTKKFHYEDCSSVQDMKGRNKERVAGTREELIDRGYEPCRRCKP